MDFSKLLSKLSVIEGKQQLNEAEKKETTWTDMSGKKHPATQVKGDKYTGKEAEKEEKEKKVKESLDLLKPVDMAALIARMDAITESEKMVDEDDVEEGNEFSGELAKAKATGKKEFEVDGKKYPVKEGAKPDFLDMDKDGDKKEPMKKAAKEKGEKVDEAEDRPAPKEKETTWTDKSGKKHPAKQVQGWQSVKADKEADKEKKETMKEATQVDECGMTASGGDMMGSPMEQAGDESGMSINTNVDTRTGHKSVSISAEGGAADELMQILKLSGVQGLGHDGGEEVAGEPEGEVAIELVPLAHQGGFEQGHEEEVEETYANEPNPKTQSVDMQMRQGTDLNKEKTMQKHSYRQGDNPMAMREAEELAALEAELMEELESIKVPVSEKYMGFKKVAAAAKAGGAKDPEAVAASIGRKKYGKEKFQKAAAAGKKMG